MCNEILLTSSVGLAIYISGLSPLVIPDKRRIRFTHQPLKLNTHTHTHSNECLFVIRWFITAVLPAVLDQQPWFSSYWSRKSRKFPKILLLLLLLISSLLNTMEYLVILLWTPIFTSNFIRVYIGESACLCRGFLIPHVFRSNIPTVG